MSLQRFSACCKQLSNKKSLEVHCKGFKEKHYGILARGFNQEVVLSPSCSELCYSTIAKPHLSKSLLKWKKRKRKSKAQRKRELEILQNDFTQLLTKRAVQLVQEQSYQSVYHRVVTTHSFTNSAIRPIAKVMEVLATESEPFHNLESGSFKFDEDFSVKVDACVPDLLQREDVSNLLSHSQPDFHVESAASLRQSHFQDLPRNGQKSYIHEFVQNYLKNKRPHDAISTASTAEFYNHSHFNPFPTTDDVFSFSHDKSIGHIQSATSQKSNEFLDLFLKFQKGMLKTSLPKRNWEENDEEMIPTPRYPAEEATSAFSSASHPYTLSKETFVKETFDNNSSVSGVENNLLRSERSIKETVIKPIPAKPDIILIPEKDNDVRFSKKEEKAAAVSKSGKKRQKRRDHRDFQELIDKSFIEACCFTGNELLAVRNIEFQSSRHVISSVDIFNRLIHALAKKQNLDAIKSLFSLLRQGNVPSSLQTYAGCLECVGRMSEPDTFLCERLLADIEKAGFELGEIANSCSFESDEIDYVLKAIRLVNPDFVPNDPPVVPGYNIEMLRSLDIQNLERVENNQYALDMDKSELMNRLQRQLEMEKSGMVLVPSIYTHTKSRQDKELNKLKEEIRDSWRKALCNSFTEKLKTFEKKAQNNMSMTIYPYLKLFPPETYVNIIFKHMQDLFSSSEAYSPTQVMFQSLMGHAVNRMYNIESRVSAGMADKVIRLYDQYSNDYLDKDFVQDNHRKTWMRAMAKHWDTVNMDLSTKKWPRHVTKMVGKFLLDLILYDLKIDANLLRPKSQQRLVPAFCTIYRPDVTTFTMAEIKVHPVVSKLFKMDSMEVFEFDPSTVPMLVPPVPWISKNMGSLLLGSYALVRLGDDLYHLDALKNVKDTQFSAVLDSLNTLSACAWKINKPLLDLQIQLFKANGDANLKLSPPASILPPLPTVKADMSGQEKAALYRQRVQLQHQKQDMHSLWCSDLYRMSIANKFRDEIFWFPHFMDFRGRTYPLPPHFNHLGSDNVRGMLLFAKGKSLGSQGHDWLKIHLINLTGFKKRSSNAERLAYADTLMEEIMDSADKPMKGRKWWQSSDEPWQTLACCMELAKIERFEGNKEDYICYFPVHQDGSCNGLQHYAALGRDKAGAVSVNLMPFDSPQDVYSDVVELVERERQKDAEEGHELAKALEGFVKRKVIKQTIMTTVYGVTRFGAKAQIHKQLRDIPDFPEDLAWKASFYLTEKTFSSLCEMFRATKDIQDWLTEAAQLISAFKPVDWVTPLGFPVVQPYFKRSSDMRRNKYTSEPNTVKQKNAFPPNYIHSLDSTHMMLTSLYCMHAGITFVSVHDCFWTHACDVPIMNKVCREQFVSMHNQPLLEDLSQHLLDLVHRASIDPSLKEEFKKVDISSLQNLLCDVPKRGDFDLNDVLESTYFFS